LFVGRDARLRQVQVAQVQRRSQRLDERQLPLSNPERTGDKWKYSVTLDGDEIEKNGGTLEDELTEGGAIRVEVK
jgi:hypothetical protein